VGVTRTLGPPVAFHATFTAVTSGIAENGDWLGGKTHGVDWQNVATCVGLAYPSVIGAGGAPSGPPYDDPTALLKGNWGNDQRVSIKVALTQRASGIFQECEARLRSSLSSGVNSGYECILSMTDNPYIQLVRWNGPLSDFTILKSCTMGSNANDGDVFTSQIVGSVITVSVNGATQFTHDTAGDSSSTGATARYTSGQPGIGFWQRSGTTGQLSRFGAQAVHVADRF
jgi:hypothetical protein